MYVIAINNGKCSCSWDYMMGNDGDYLRFKDEEEAYSHIMDNNLNINNLHVIEF